MLKLHCPLEITLKVKVRATPALWVLSVGSAVLTTKALSMNTPLLGVRIAVTSSTAEPQNGPLEP
jgi:hypothetical protein